MRLERLISTIALCFACGAEAPADLGPLPAFALTNQEGQAVSNADLEETPWVANVIFTTCPSVCPLLTSQMANLERRTRGTALTFVSVSVDPETDTPEVLRQYAQSHDANLSRWHFLTGETLAVQNFIEGGLKLRMGERIDSGDITHGSHFVLIDGSGHHRGFFRTDTGGMNALEAAINAL